MVLPSSVHSKNVAYFERWSTF